jgi:PKD repeat protein
VEELAMVCAGDNHSHTGIRLLSVLTILLLVFGSVFLNVPSALASASPTLEITIYRMRLSPGDQIETAFEGGADWHYYVQVYDGNRILNASKEDMIGNRDDWTANMVHSFAVNAVTVSIMIQLLDDDWFSRQAVADISGYPGGGSEILQGNVSRGAEFHATYDLRTNTLAGDRTETEMGYLKTSGDYDGSTAVDENDADLWFLVTDNYEQPTAAATVNAGDNQPIYSGDKVNFDASASKASDGSSITQYQWDFESDGKVDAEGVRTDYSFTRQGASTGTLTITDNFGETDAHHFTVTISNRPPVASFTTSPSQATIKDIICFTDESTDQDGTLKSWQWDFGDGTSSGQQNPTHRYSDKGSYAVRLTVTDNKNAKGSVTGAVVIINSLPSAGFSLNNTSPGVREEILFTDQSIDPENRTLTYSWDFGDGTLSTLRNPSHDFDEARNYTVRLTVTDDEGAKGYTSRLVSVKSSQQPFSERRARIYVAGGIVLTGLIAAIGFVYIRTRPLPPSP